MTNPRAHLLTYPTYTWQYCNNNYAVVKEELRERDIRLTLEMSTDHKGGKGYTPLPQSISNTDTEDEEERLTRPNHLSYQIDNTTTIAVRNINI